ncbi:hypothetical protein K458DRAFT_419357 [Lentithecium fluviatile CBS 122367]|uniref:Uncharacterized protein n=1 Tax=Lentithecium fluviatile CBS 122367 TaxID=1168545 RepID=A0A6G1IYY2_9PLEO|nr:hypothetical protein K458DRAFT_419357 [Lentithecium fluviatile CBS 122367]
MCIPSFSRLTPLTYGTFLAAILLIGLSGAEVALTAQYLHAFRHFEVQYPGSSLAEWAFVKMDPSNLDTGPTSAKFTVGTCGLVAALLATLWIVLLWCGVGEIKVRKLAIMSCIATIANTVGSVAFLTYVFVREGQNKLPEYFMQWKETTFTAEYYICEAFPTVFEDPNRLYGFPACGTALAAKFILIGISCLSVVLAGLVVMKAQKTGAFRSKDQWRDLEARPTLPAMRNTRQSAHRDRRRPRQLLPTSTRIPHPGNARIQEPPHIKIGGVCAPRYT